MKGSVCIEEYIKKYIFDHHERLVKPARSVIKSCSNDVELFWSKLSFFNLSFGRLVLVRERSYRVEPWKIPLLNLNLFDVAVTNEGGRIFVSLEYPADHLSIVYKLETAL